MSGEMGRSMQAMAELGFFQQVKLYGFAAAYGGMIRFMALDRESRAQSYSEVMKDIDDGTFGCRVARRSGVRAPFSSVAGWNAGRG